MNTLNTQHEYPIYPTNQDALRQRQAERRQMLGLLLIVVGATWLFLRLWGGVGDILLPITWLTRAEHCTIGGWPQSVGMTVCGMLAVDLIHRAR